MSGGSYDYAYHHMHSFVSTLRSSKMTLEREHFIKLCELVAEAMYAIEWVDSDDYGPGDENKPIVACFEFARDVYIPKSQASEILRKPYSWVLTPEENGWWSGKIAEFKGCVAEGPTQREACNNLEKAALSWLEAALAQGLEIPEPVRQDG